jgi:hypothetical protein
LLFVTLEVLKLDVLPALNERFLDTTLRFRTLPTVVTGVEDGPNIHGDKTFVLLFFDFSWNDLFKNMFTKKPFVTDVGLRSFSLFLLALGPSLDDLLNNSSTHKMDNDTITNVLKVIRSTMTAVKKNSIVKITLKSNILFKPISFSRGFVETKR